MKKQILKTLLICGIILIALAAATAAYFSLKTEPAPLPEELLARAESPETENICLFALLEKDSAQPAYWERLLKNLAAEGADALTFRAVLEEAKRNGAEGSAAPTGEAVIPRVENRSPSEGLAAGERLLDHFPNANSIAGSGALLFESAETGVYVHYYSCVRFLSPVRAARMIATDRGLFYLNAAEKRVQYVAADGSVTRTLSPISAADYAFFKEKLFIAGTDGVLYADGAPLETPGNVNQLAVCGERLFALTESGLWCSDPALILPDNAKRISGSSNGNLYYISAEGFPCVFDPEGGEAAILRKKPCYAVEEMNGKIYVFYEKTEEIA